MLDLAIVGGGLAGGLSALAVHRRHPDMQIGLFDAGPSFGGNHRWSWFASDLDPAGAALLDPFPKTEWNDGYDVRFPGHCRTLASAYRSLSSRDFDSTLRRKLPQESLRPNTRVGELLPDGIVLDDGVKVDARVVIDCRNFEPSPHLRGGWQVFMGRHLQSREPHGLHRPIVMDAAVRQHDAYRFVYTLPITGDELFVEDTYYADAPELDREILSGRIDRYCETQGWNGQSLGGETGVLPVITGGEFDAYRRSLGVPGVVRAGARGGFTHPLTSYTLPFAVANALFLADAARMPGAQLAAVFEDRAQEHWRAMQFYRRLGRMLFDAAKPDQRYRIFERFYRLREPLIERFYAGRSTTSDKIRVLAGRPPVPVGAAIGALLGKGSPLVHGDGR